MLSRAEVFRRLEHCVDANARRGITLRAGNVECQVHIEAERALVVIAGSNQVKDWIRNLEIAKVRVAGVGGVHIGRKRDWDQIETPLRRYLDEHAPGLPLDFAGHSQGGGIIQYGATQLDRPVRSVVTYGSHRLFDEEAAEVYKSKVLTTRRVVVGWDGVPRWPKNNMGYVHAGPMLCLSKKGKQLKEQQAPAWYRPWEYAIAFADNHIGHDEYYRAIRDWAREAPEALA